jgi:hypothetical protein
VRRSQSCPPTSWREHAAQWYGDSREVVEHPEGLKGESALKGWQGVLDRNRATEPRWPVIAVWGAGPRRSALRTRQRSLAGSSSRRSAGCGRCQPASPTPGPQEAGTVRAEIDRLNRHRQCPAPARVSVVACLVVRQHPAPPIRAPSRWREADDHHCRGRPSD